MRTRIPFVKLPAATLGHLLISAIRYALRSGQRCLIESMCAILREQYKDDSVPAPMCDVMIEDIRRRHEPFRRAPTERYDDLWIKTLAVLTEPPDLHCARHGAPDGKIVSIKQNELVELLSAALHYALGRHSHIVGFTYDWIRDLAPQLHRNDRASLASDIRCYLEKPRPDEFGCDDKSWRDTLEFFQSLDRRPATRGKSRRR